MQNSTRGRAAPALKATEKNRSWMRSSPRGTGCRSPCFLRPLCTPRSSSASGSRGTSNMHGHRRSRSRSRSTTTASRPTKPISSPNRISSAAAMPHEARETTTTETADFHDSAFRQVASDPTPQEQREAEPQAMLTTSSAARRSRRRSNRRRSGRTAPDAVGSAAADRSEPGDREPRSARRHRNQHRSEVAAGAPADERVGPRRRSMRTICSRGAARSRRSATSTIRKKRAAISSTAACG